MKGWVGGGGGGGGGGIVAFVNNWGRPFQLISGSADGKGYYIDDQYHDDK